MELFSTDLFLIFRILFRDHKHTVHFILVLQQTYHCKLLGTADHFKTCTLFHDVREVNNTCYHDDVHLANHVVQLLPYPPHSWCRWSLQHSRLQVPRIILSARLHVTLAPLPITRTVQSVHKMTQSFVHQFQYFTWGETPIVSGCVTLHLAHTTYMGFTKQWQGKAPEFPFQRGQLFVDFVMAAREQAACRDAFQQFSSDSWQLSLQVHTTGM
jgi:hypothetical protein